MSPGTTKRRRIVGANTTTNIQLDNEPWYYKKKSHVPESTVNYEDVGNKIPLLLVVASDIEFETFYFFLTPTPPNRFIQKVFHQEQTYYIGLFGILRTVLVQQTNMGSSDEGSSLLTVRDSIDAFNPRIVILAGIAWGRGSEKQELGDVMVAKHILPLQANERWGLGYPISRHSIPQTSTILLNRLMNSVREWKMGTNVKPKKEWKIFRNRKELEFHVHIGDIVSANAVLDNSIIKKEIIEKYRSAIGGDMESWGTYVGVNRWNKDNIQRYWIVVKSICDLGENKSDDFQAIAAATASDFLHHAFNKPEVTKDIIIDYSSITSVKSSVELMNIQRPMPNIDIISLYTLIYTPIIIVDSEIKAIVILNMELAMPLFCKIITFQKYVKMDITNNTIINILNQDYPQILEDIMPTINSIDNTSETNDNIYLVENNASNIIFMSYKRFKEWCNYLFKYCSSIKLPYDNEKSIKVWNIEKITPDIPTKLIKTIIFDKTTKIFQKLHGEFLILEGNIRHMIPNGPEGYVYIIGRVMQCIDKNTRKMKVNEKEYFYFLEEYWEYNNSYGNSKSFKYHEKDIDETDAIKLEYGLDSVWLGM